MGIAYDVMKLIDNGQRRCGVDYDGLKMCEFGYQSIRRRTYPKDHMAYTCDTDRSYPSKKYFGELGVDYTSMDLTVQMNENQKGSFDLLTNCGMSEHVRKSQWHVFSNIHNVVRLKGAMVHSVGMFGSPLKGHSIEKCVYYMPNFFDKLAVANGYSLEYKKVLRRKDGKGGLLSVVMIKLKDNGFMSETDFKAMGSINYNSCV